MDVVPPTATIAATNTPSPTGTLTPGANPTVTHTPVVTSTPTQPAGAPTSTPTPNPLCSVSIGDGQLYTNQRNIIVYANVADAAEVQLSNDGGFGNAVWQPYASTLTWTLSNPPQEVTTLLVFARFRNAQGELLCGSTAVIDDIIYDAKPPTIKALSFTANGEATAQEATIFNGTLTIEATDQQGGSGVLQMRIGVQPDLADANWRPFVSPDTVSLPEGQAIYAQVKDGAGNESNIASWGLEAGWKTYLPILKR